jgi:isoleucyl-tRNA synthetase
MTNNDHPHVPHFLDGEVKLPEVEEKVLAYWDAHHMFEKSLAQTEGGDPFTFYDGPPFATGLPHYGHILASTIKDLVPRYETMRGRYVRRRWGWDCHGLPIEEIVERKLGISGKKQIEEIGIKTFNETCRSTVLTYASEWRAMVRRIARWVDFDHSYKTMDTDYMESVWWAFKTMYDKGLIYEGRKVLLYCPRCETPVSNFEVAMDNSYKDVQEESVYVKFPLKSGQKLGREYMTKEGDSLMAWTTTPWTLPGNVALAVGDAIRYAAVRIKSAPGLFIIAHDLAAKVFQGEEIEMVQGDIAGTDLVGLAYEPLFDVPEARNENSHKVYAADFVNTEDGTGIVHTAVVYGEDDYQLGLRENLPVVPLLDEKGMFNEKAPEFVRGMYFKDAERFIKNDLEKRGLLYKREQHIHSYPFCWRCGTTLYYNAIPAWFVNVQKIKKDILKSNDKEIEWYPAHLKHGRYEKSVEAAPDWNISRNRYWGNPVPVWKCAECGAVEAVGSLDALAARAGESRNHYFCLRHGESDNVIKQIIDSGDQDSHLTEKGKKEVAYAAKELKKNGIDLIVASDILRTKETAEIVAAELGGIPIHYDKRLRELNLASLSGKPLTEYWERIPVAIDRFTGHAVPDAESLADLRMRGWEFLKEMEEKHHGKNILVVSHEDTIWMLSQAANGWSDEAAGERKWKTGNFVDPAGIVAFGVKRIPRNDTGAADMHRPYIDEVTFPCAACAKTGKEGVMARTPEIFDSWIEAGSMPFAEFHYPFEHKKEFEARYPAQFVAEYIAQTRAWFYLMHVLGVALFDKAPFEHVVTTGTILAEDGAKMSKSKNNFPDPKLLIDKFGADALRFYLMNSVVMQADNLNFSEKGVEGVYRKVNMLVVNVYKYFATYAAEAAEGRADADREVSARAQALDLWIRTRTAELVDAVGGALDGYDTVRATRVIQEYVDDLSTWYLRRSRKRKDGDFFATMKASLATFAKVLAPFMPLLADALWLDLTRGTEGESVHCAAWPTAEYPLKDKERAELVEDMAEVRRLASAALAGRAAAKIKVRQPLASLTVGGAGRRIRRAELLDLLKDEVNVKEVAFDAQAPEGVVLDTTITPELREEGLVRECIRMIQELRQKADLVPGDTVAVMADLPPAMKTAVAAQEDFVKKETGTKSFGYGRADAYDAEEEIAIDGGIAWIAIRKI